jgi:hypothetical protein
MKIFKVSTVAIFVATLLLSACKSDDPGPLKGTWYVGGIMPMKTTFRNGETETMGIIEPVSYKVDGNSVLVKYEDGPFKGASIRYTIVGKNTAVSESGTMKRISK